MSRGSGVVGWENEALKKRYFDFEGHFHSLRRMWVGKIGYSWNRPCVEKVLEPIRKKISPKIISLEPFDRPPPIWPPSSPDLAISEKPSFHMYFSRSCSIIFLLANFHYICSRDQRFSRKREVV